MSQLAELRKILVGEQADKIDLIKDRLDQVALRSKDVAEVLPEAILHAHEEREDDLGKAFSPTVSSALKTTIQRDPQGFADIFYPALAPAIRAMVANMIRSFTESMNQTIESATSLKGLKWRLESIRTGIPYTDLALRSSLQYRVEQVFLIQPGTGLLIEHVLNDNVLGIDSDAVSGMLTAIQSFVTDSFDAKSGENLTNMKVGELTVWMVHGPQAMIACVIRGDAPHALRGQLIDVLDQIHMKYAIELSEFDGESKIIGVHDVIEPCLQLELKNIDGAAKSKTSWVTMLLFFALLLSVFYWLWSSYDKNQIRNQSSQLLAKTPGVLATDVFWDDDTLNVVGLIDPLAELPWKDLEKIGLKQDQTVLEMKKFRSLEPEILIKRLKNGYQFPDDLKITLDDSGNIVLAKLEGELSYADYSRVKLKTGNSTGSDVQFDVSGLSYQEGTFGEYVDNVLGIPKGVSIRDANGVLHVDGLPNQEWLVDLAAQMSRVPEITLITVNDLQKNLQQFIGSQVVNFESAVILLPAAAQKLNTLVSKLNELRFVLSLQQKMPQISLTGFSDGGSATPINKRFRRLRAEHVYQLLMDKGVAPEILKVLENRNPDVAKTKSVKFRIEKFKATVADKVDLNPLKSFVK